MDRLVVELRRSGRTVTVAPELTVLEALEDNGIEVPSMCRAGICGTCETPVLAAEFAPEVRAPATLRLCVTESGTMTRLALDL
ncbi:2Fe-2S iron-sulfur cluster binding domain-containing protein [Nocardia sp. XZ_19_385]|uniref:2Fe-2S iron-sulfur cluster-binding protein n=1 Tax=Nocardia sp. XZ_19_385 TaxID=2769488 RepID=UPI001E3D4BDB|nr:2Fe-2S iron-sulfur cluster binding domain-containing protein [Nocardia sp. XZ_19_385]